MLNVQPNNASSLEGIQELFEEINQKESKLDILVNNAGCT